MVLLILHLHWKYCKHQQGQFWKVSTEIKAPADGKKSLCAKNVPDSLAATTLQLFKKSLERYIAGNTNPNRFQYQWSV